MLESTSSLTWPKPTESNPSHQYHLLKINLYLPSWLHSKNRGLAPASPHQYQLVRGFLPSPKGFSTRQGQMNTLTFQTYPLLEENQVSCHTIWMFNSCWFNYRTQRTPGILSPISPHGCNILLCMQLHSAWNSPSASLNSQPISPKQPLMPKSSIGHHGSYTIKTSVKKRQPHKITIGHKCIWPFARSASWHQEQLQWIGVNHATHNTWVDAGKMGSHWCCAGTTQMAAHLPSIHPSVTNSRMEGHPRRHAMPTMQKIDSAHEPIASSYIPVISAEDSIHNTSAVNYTQMAGKHTREQLQRQNWTYNNPTALIMNDFSYLGVHINTLRKI